MWGLIISPAGIDFIPMERPHTPLTDHSLFAQNNWNGLTLDDHLILQRMFAKLFKDHRFDGYSKTSEQSQCGFLLDARVPRGVAVAYWNPESRRVSGGWRGTGSSDPLLGARPAVVVEVKGICKFGIWRFDSNITVVYTIVISLSL